MASALRANGATEVAILVTHGHPDHAPGAAPLAALLRDAGLAVEVAGPAGVKGVERALDDGDVTATDAGDLVAVWTPGHARGHVALHWPARRAAFVGDLLLGKGDTVWVGEYAGSVADYLSSLERVRALETSVLYPAHGPSVDDPGEALNRFAAHRRERIAQVASALEAAPGVTAEALLEQVYGSALPSGVRRAALMSMEALIAHVEGRRDDP